MLKPTIFLAEDEENLADTIKLNLELDNYFVETASNGSKALDQILNHRYDLIILDVMLPEMDGFTICEQLRKKGNNTPVLFLTAKGTSTDKIMGLKIGGDDYMTKPFNLEEFLLRVKNLIKRNSKLFENELNEYSFGENHINFITFEVSNFRNEKETLSKREIDLLKVLILKKNEVISRDDILDLLWKDSALPTPRTIDNFILTFRKLFEENPKEPKHFHSIRGVGYKFTP